MVAASEKSLAEILFQQQQLGTPIPVALTLAILRQISEALDWAHNLRDAAGNPLDILHRDVCPANIYIDHIGVARLVASTAPQANPGYVAPEALLGHRPDQRADLFSLGVVAHEMLTGRPLFHGANEHDTLSRVCTLAIPLPSTINPAVTADIEGIVLMALARDPTYRCQSASMLRDGLVSVAQRHGFELGPQAANAWFDLYAGRPIAPLVPVVREPPRNTDPDPSPLAGDQWSESTSSETGIQAQDARIVNLPAKRLETLDSFEQEVATEGAVETMIAMPKPSPSTLATVVAIVPAPAPAAAFATVVADPSQWSGSGETVAEIRSPWASDSSPSLDKTARDLPQMSDAAASAELAPAKSFELTFDSTGADLPPTKVEGQTPRPSFHQVTNPPAKTFADLPSPNAKPIPSLQRPMKADLPPIQAKAESSSRTPRPAMTELPASNDASSSRTPRRNATTAEPRSKDASSSRIRRPSMTADLPSPRSSPAGGSPVAPVTDQSSSRTPRPSMTSDLPSSRAAPAPVSDPPSARLPRPSMTSDLPSSRAAAVVSDQPSPPPPRPSMTSDLPSSRAPQAYKSGGSPVAPSPDLPAPRTTKPYQSGGSPVTRAAETADLPAPRARKPSSGASPVAPASDSPSSRTSRAVDPGGLPAPRASRPAPADLPAPRAARPSNQPPNATDALFADLPSPKPASTVDDLFADLPSPRAKPSAVNDALFADLPAPKPSPNPRRAAQDDLPAPVAPRARPAPTKPAGKKHPRASTADVEAFLASVPEDDLPPEPDVARFSSPSTPDPPAAANQGARAGHRPAQQGYEQPAANQGGYPRDQQPRANQPGGHDQARYQQPAANQHGRYQPPGATPGAYDPSGYPQPGATPGDQPPSATPGGYDPSGYAQPAANQPGQRAYDPSGDHRQPNQPGAYDRSGGNQPDPGASQQPAPQRSAFDQVPPSGVKPFELELGEFTQIGAAPLIAFGKTGETPLALVGVVPKPSRTAAPSLPPPVAMIAANRVDDVDEAPPLKKMVMIVLGALLVIAGAVIAFLIFSD